MIKDLKEKKYILENDILKKYNQEKKKIYQESFISVSKDKCLFNGKNEDNLIFNQNIYNKKMEDLKSGLDDIYRVCNNLNRAKNKRVKRCYNRIALYACFPNCYFLTLTFNDNYLNNSTEKSRRRNVRYFLHSNCIQYVANIDYGSKNEREHYHAIVNCNDISKLQKWLKMGFYSVKKVGNESKDSKKLANYINKLAFHCLKESTKNNYVIYSDLSNELKMYGLE